MSFGRAAALILTFVALACYLTWPQCVFLATRVAAHDDGLFSPWRLAWIAYALRTDPSRLYDANIFYPDRGTLANSDAVILQGALGSPLLWAGASPVMVYNVLLLGGIVASGCAMFVLARHLIGDDRAALVAAVIFMMVPYRVEHFEHLELQWACFIPLTFWMVHRAFDESSFRHGVLAGVFLWFQLIACVYYGVFLALMAVALTALLLMTTRRNRPDRILAGLMVGALAAAALALVSMRPYLENVSRVGLRASSEVSIHSAVFSSYFSAPAENWLWGWTSPMFHGDELHLFPGLIAMALAIGGLAIAPRRTALVYGLVLLLAVEMSFGLNGWLYPWLLDRLTPLRGLRATARASIFAFAALAVLAGFAVRWLLQKWPMPRAMPAPAALVLAALSLEYGSAPMNLLPAPSPAPVYQLLSQLPKGAVAEFPMPRRLQGSAYDPLYMFSSVSHWFPLVNGYSGFIPEQYQKTLDVMSSFPDDVAIARLRKVGTRYIIVHEYGYSREDHLAIISQLRARHDVVPFGRYRDVGGLHAELFELKPRRELGD
jgi:hypothetical protein